VASERGGGGFDLALAGVGAGTGDGGEFGKDDRGVFNEYPVGMLWEGGSSSMRDPRSARAVT